MVNRQEKLGFKFWKINEQAKKIESIEIPELLKTYPPEKRNYTNLLCSREEFVVKRRILLKKNVSLLGNLVCL